jgi:hypothetical protein
MTDVITPTLVPYSRFLECQDRRRHIAAELTPRDQPPATDPQVVPPPADLVSAPPLMTATVC